MASLPQKLCKAKKVIVEEEEGNPKRIRLASGHLLQSWARILLATGGRVLSFELAVA